MSHERRQERPDIKERIDIFVAEREIRKAAEYLSRNQVTDHLGLTDTTDTFIFTAYFSERLLRVGVYNYTSYLRSPLAHAVSKIPFFGHRTLNKQQEEEDRRKYKLSQVEQYISQFVGRESTSTDRRRYVRDLELAANMLVSRATVRVRDEAVVILTRQLVQEWGEEWKKRLGLRE